MINKLTIQNFKSIKKLDIDCKKLNVFIGEPNSGKSNIIEALALKSQGAITSTLSKDIFRYKIMGDLFYDFDINSPISVKTDLQETELVYAMRNDNTPENQFSFFVDKPDAIQKEKPFKLSHDGKVVEYGNAGKTDVHYYEYKRLSSFSLGYQPHLSVPFGDNLPGLLLANGNYKNWVSDFFKSKGLRLTLRPSENEIAVSKFVDDQIYSYPYFSISETLQRVVFYTMAIMSNKNATLLFDEPESNTFPFYTKSMAEMIALDETNQFFITTHNPYLLLSLIEKSKLENLNVCIASMKDYQTEVQVLNEEQISKVLDFNSDVFFNFNQILGE